MSYLTSWRTSVWVSIREKESNCWKFLALFGSAVAAIIGFAPSNAAIEMKVIAIAGLAILGVFVVLDANYWNCRNVRIVANIERYIAPYVYRDRLLPISYAWPRFRYVLNFRGMIDVCFLAMEGALIWAYATYAISVEGWRVILCSVTIMSAWACFQDWQRRMDYTLFEAGLPARDALIVPDRSNLDQQRRKKLKYEMSEICLQSPITQGFLSVLLVMAVISLIRLGVHNLSWWKVNNTFVFAGAVLYIRLASWSVAMRKKGWWGRVICDAALLIVPGTIIGVGLLSIFADSQSSIAR